MRRIFIRLVLSAAAIPGLLLSQESNKSETKQLSIDELKKLIEEGKSYFLDVREPKEIEELGTIKGYVNIPLSQLEQRVGEIPKDALVITA